MPDIYSQSFLIPPTGGTMALVVANGLYYNGLNNTIAPGLTLDVVLFRDASYVGNTLVNNAPTRISLMPGYILPVKIRGISHNAQSGTSLVGFN